MKSVLKKHIGILYKKVGSIQLGYISNTVFYYVHVDMIIRL